MFIQILAIGSTALAIHAAWRCDLLNPRDIEPEENNTTAATENSTTIISVTAEDIEGFGFLRRRAPLQSAADAAIAASRGTDSQAADGEEEAASSFWLVDPQCNLWSQEEKSNLFDVAFRAGHAFAILGTVFSAASLSFLLLLTCLEFEKRLITGVSVLCTASSICEGLSLLAALSRICQRTDHDCRLGTAFYFAIAASSGWLLVGAFMGGLVPFSKESDESMVQQDEESYFPPVSESDADSCLPSISTSGSLDVV